MRKLIIGAGMAISTISALAAPAYAADVTENGAVKLTEQPTTAAQHTIKLKTDAAMAKDSGPNAAAENKITTNSAYKMDVNNRVSKNPDMKSTKPSDDSSGYMK